MEIYYFMLTAGGHHSLVVPLSDGQANFERGVVYQTRNYADIVKLCGGGNPCFVQVYDANGSLEPPKTPDVLDEDSPKTEDVVEAEVKPAERKVAKPLDVKKADTSEVPDETGKDS